MAHACLSRDIVTNAGANTNTLGQTKSQGAGRKRGAADMDANRARATRRVNAPQLNFGDNDASEDADAAGAVHYASRVPRYR